MLKRIIGVRTINAQIGYTIRFQCKISSNKGERIKEKKHITSTNNECGTKLSKKNTKMKSCIYSSAYLHCVSEKYGTFFFSRNIQFCRQLKAKSFDEKTCFEATRAE